MELMTEQNILIEARKKPGSQRWRDREYSPDQCFLTFYDNDNCNGRVGPEKDLEILQKLAT